jgi:hypothetical protein
MQILAWRNRSGDQPKLNAALLTRQETYAQQLRFWKGRSSIAMTRRTQFTPCLICPVFRGKKQFPVACLPFRGMLYREADLENLTTQKPIAHERGIRTI